jgi:GLPGLI family protein
LNFFTPNILEKSQAMRYFFAFLLLLLANLLSAQQSPSVRIVYENVDAYNPLIQKPYLAPYINRVEQAKPIKGKERSSLRLYEGGGIFTVDSVYVESPGNKANFLRYSIISVKDYTLKRGFSIYHNVAAGFAYFESYDDKLTWEIDKTKVKNILGINCHFASTKIGQDLHHIWFTNALPYRDGPFLAAKPYNSNLPGLVLEHTMGDGYTTTAVNIEFIADFPNLKDKIVQLKAWEKTPKPDYPPEDPHSRGLVLINTESPTHIWIPLLYEAEGHEGWLSNR